MANEERFKMDDSVEIEWLDSEEFPFSLSELFLEDEEKRVTQCALLREFSHAGRRFAVVAKWADLEAIEASNGGAESPLDVEIYDVSGASGEMFDLVTDLHLLRDLIPLVDGMEDLEFRCAVA